MTRGLAASLLAPGALLAILAGPAAQAGEVVVSPDFTLAYGDPTGYCLLEPEKSPDEKHLFESAQGSLGADSTVRLLALLVDCPTLEALRTPGATVPAALASLGFGVEIRDGEPFRSGDDRRDFVAARAKLLTASAQAIAETARQKGVDPATLRDVTTDDSDAEVFAFGMAVLDPANGDVGFAYAVTLIQGHGVMTLSLRSPPADGGVPAQIAEARALAHDVIDRNDPAGKGSGAGGILGFFDSPWVKASLFFAIALSGIAMLLQQRKARRAARNAKP